MDNVKYNKEKIIEALSILDKILESLENSFNEIDKAEAYYICCENDSKELYETLKNWVKTNEFKKWLDE